MVCIYGQIYKNMYIQTFICVQKNLAGQQVSFLQHTLAAYICMYIQLSYIEECNDYTVVIHAFDIHIYISV